MRVYILIWDYMDERELEIRKVFKNKHSAEIALIEAQMIDSLGRYYLEAHHLEEY